MEEKGLTHLLDEERPAEPEARGVRPGALDVGEEHGDDGWLNVLTRQLWTL